MNRWEWDLLADCPYGDHVAGCVGQVDADYCKEDAGVREQCCGTCRTLMRRASLDLIGEFFFFKNVKPVQNLPVGKAKDDKRKARKHVNNAAAF
jgi:hypothetical protein